MRKETVSANFTDRTIAISRYRFTLPELLLLLMGVVSLAYAVITAPSQGIDMRYFHDGASDWVSGNYRFDRGTLLLYPPFTLVLVSVAASVESRFGNCCERQTGSPAGRDFVIVTSLVCGYT